MDTIKKSTASQSSKLIENISKWMKLQNDVIKFLGFNFLLFVATAALAKPDWVNSRLNQLNLSIDGISTPFFKLVKKETTKANLNAAQASEALTQAQIMLTNATIPNHTKIPGDSNSIELAMAKALGFITDAQKDLDQQAISILKTGVTAGAIQNIPTTGWINVGLYSNENILIRPSDRIQRTKEIERIDDNNNNKLKKIILSHDAIIISEVDECSIIDISKMPIPDSNAPEHESAIVRKSLEQPLFVRMTKSCATRSKEKMFYAQVDIPADRIRFSQLSSFK